MSTEHLAETIHALHALFEPALEREGLELVDLAYKRAGRKGYLLRLTIDRSGRTNYDPPPRDEEGAAAFDGVTISDCVRVSKLLSPLLDVEDPIPGPYQLEVSSPGVNRPLKKPSHFQLAIGSNVRVKTRVPVDGESLFVAQLRAADQDGIALAGPRAVEIPYRLISQANLEYEF